MPADLVIIFALDLTTSHVKTIDKQRSIYKSVNLATAINYVTI